MQTNTIAAFQTWNLETVRTLALVNSAGPAGVSAIYASDSAAKAYLWTYPAAELFAIGLICALLNMYANSQGHLRAHQEIFSRLVDFDAGKLEPQAAGCPFHPDARDSARISAMLENRFPLLNKRGHSFLLILGGKERMEHVTLEMVLSR